MLKVVRSQDSSEASAWGHHNPRNSLGFTGCCADFGRTKCGWSQRTRIRNLCMSLGQTSSHTDITHTLRCSADRADCAWAACAISHTHIRFSKRHVFHVQFLGRCWNLTKLSRYQKRKICNGHIWFGVEMENRKLQVQVYNDIRGTVVDKMSQKKPSGSVTGYQVFAFKIRRKWMAWTRTGKKEQNH